MNIEEKDFSYLEKLPIELHFKILLEVDSKTALNCRAVCKRWQRIISKIAERSELFKPLELSRLVVTGMPRKDIEIRWVAYTVQQSSSLILPQAMLHRRVCLGFNFAQFKVKRIILQNLTLTDEVVDFLRIQLAYSDLTSLLHLSLNHVDFSKSNSLTLHRLLAPLARHLEVFELNQLTGVKSDSVTDSHLAQLDATKTRRIAIDGIRFMHSHRRTTLRVGDESLRRFASQRCFPTLVLDRCAVTTKMVCEYTERWLASVAESDRNLRSQICTMKRCPGIKGQQFETECRRRGLHCKHRKSTGSLVLHNVQAEQAETEFTVATQPVEVEETMKKENDTQKPLEIQTPFDAPSQRVMHRLPTKLGCKLQLPKAADDKPGGKLLLISGNHNTDHRWPMPRMGDQCNDHRLGAANGDRMIPAKVQSQTPPALRLSPRQQRQLLR